MIRIGQLGTWFVAPPAKGVTAMFCAIAAVVVPTLIRLAVDDMVLGSAFAPYLPFVLAAAILLDWRAVVPIVLVSAIVADLFFVGPDYQLLEGPSDIFGLAVFLTSSALIVGLIQATRCAFRKRQRLLEEIAEGAIFSLEDGHAWVRTSRNSSSVRLGPQDEVAGMMEDFLAQLEVGKRLTR